MPTPSIGRTLFIKIPATLASLPVITASMADGISVNVTLFFLLERYGAVLDEFLTGLEQRKADSGSLAGIEGVASFFIGPVDTEVDGRLGRIAVQVIGRDPAAELDRLRGQAALANARPVYEIFDQILVYLPEPASKAIGVWRSRRTRDALLAVRF